MTRKKRSRKTGPLAPSSKDKQHVREQRAATEEKKSRGKGSKAGSRQQVKQPAKGVQSGSNQPGDPRVGSKKPIKLITPGKAVEKPTEKPAKPLFDTPIPDDLDTVQQQLLALENDETFMAQLEVVDEGGILPTLEQNAFEQKLQRYEQLLEKAEELDEDNDPLAALMQDGAGFKDDWS